MTPMFAIMQTRESRLHFRLHLFILFLYRIIMLINVRVAGVDLPLADGLGWIASDHCVCFDILR